jgi:hypothetical protein
MVPSATSLTMSPVFPNFLYFITPVSLLLKGMPGTAMKVAALV